MTDRPDATHHPLQEDDAGGLTLAATVARAAEIAVHEERQRLAQQLHDTVGAMLFTLGAGVRRLGEDLAHVPGLSARLTFLERHTAETTATFREALRALHAPPDSLALPVALQADCRSFEERTGIQILLLVLDDVPPLPAAQAGALVAAVREALLNIEKHAEAGAVLVNVARTGHGVTVAVQDDGVGLAPDWADRAGLGLSGATDRLGRLGGGLRIDGNDDGGVTVRAWIPA